MSLPPKIPTVMRAIEITEAGAPEVLQLCERPVPAPKAGEIIIKVAYAGVNRPDALQRAGLYNPPAGASDLPGLECAGEVVAIGSDVTEWRVGDQVCALLPGGGYAEYVATPAVHALPAPKGLSLREAACLPETFFTVWSNVFMRGGLQADETFLVHGGSSGIGTTAIQLARAFGARVFATAGSAEKCMACVNLGAERAINYHDEDFVEVLQAEGGADLILDMVGGSYFPRNLKALGLDGRLVNIAFLTGAKAEINLMQVMVKRLTLTGSNLRPQSIKAKATIAQELFSRVWPLIEAGQVAPVMHSEFAFEDAASAHRLMETNAHIGKIVLRVA